jgi:hypothetical protein
VVKRQWRVTSGYGFSDWYTHAVLPKLPSNGTLKKKIETRAVQSSLKFLISRREALAPFHTLEDFFVEPPDPLPADLKGIENHLGVVCGRFRVTLYSYLVFIGGSVLDQLVFDMIRNSEIDDPIGEALHLVRSAGIHKPGAVLYPLHSFGLLGVGLLEKLTRSKYELFAAEGELCVRGQTNNLSETIRFVESAAARMGIRRRVPVDLIEHYSRSRPTKWLTHNPLLLVKARTFTGDYYENQRFLMLHLERACSLLFMLHTFETALSTRTPHLFSTARMNNWSTLDIHHFILLEAKARSSTRFQSKCIPMNYRAVELAELSSVNVEINLPGWAHRRPVMSQMCHVLSVLENGYLQTNVLGNGKPSKRRLFQKMMTSLRYFRRSFRYTSGEDDVINMTIALEVLLTDSYAPGIGERLSERTAVLLKGYRKRRVCADAVEAVYEARNEAVHSGIRTVDVDLPTVREAYVRCLMKMVDRIPNLPLDTPDPMTRLVLLCGK